MTVGSVAQTTVAPTMMQEINRRESRQPGEGSGGRGRGEDGGANQRTALNFY